MSLNELGNWLIAVSLLAGAVAIVTAYRREGRNV